MPAIPESTRGSITLRLLKHAREHWPKLENLQVKSRAGFAYITVGLPGEEHQPLFRLRYGGSAHSFGFALYSHATGRYEDSLLATGSPVGTPQEALDTACILYYADDAKPSTEPPTNLRADPLRNPSLQVSADPPLGVGEQPPGGEEGNV
ncbi:MAG: hypothetical protein J2P30_25420, partial [Actinobacteria bacterium]|nr:hypothetical protein [Actinomycetota bacterium]